MKIIRQIFIILAFYILGEIAALGVSALFPSVFVPGTILGMIFLLIALTAKVLPQNHVDGVGTFLTSNMAFFFIPAAVSVLEYFEVLKTAFWKIILIIVVGVFVSFFAVAGAVKLTMKMQAAWRAKRGDGHA
jgi:holin-like protein